MKHPSRAALAGTLVLLSIFPSEAAAARILPSAILEYTTGSNAYFGQAGSAEISIGLNRVWSSNLIYTYSSNTDFSHDFIFFVSSISSGYVIGILSLRLFCQKP